MTSEASKPNTGSVQVYVGNIKYETTEEELFDLANKYVKVVSAKIPTKAGRSRGFGFLTVSNEKDLETLREKLDNTTFQGRIIYIKSATHSQGKDGEHEDAPRRAPPPPPPPERGYMYPPPLPRYRDERDYYSYYGYDARDRRRGMYPPPMDMPPLMMDPYEAEYYSRGLRYREDYGRGRDYYGSRFREDDRYPRIRPSPPPKKGE